MPHLLMDNPPDLKEAMIASLGDLSGIELFHNQVLLCLYLRPNKTKSGLYLTDNHIDEDKYQSKVGLLIGKGSTAFVEDDKWFTGLTFSVGNDWLIFRPSDGWGLTVNGVLCRVFDDVSIKGRILSPDEVY